MLMDVVVVAVRDGVSLPLGALQHALQMSQEPLELLESLPEVMARKSMSAAHLASMFASAISEAAPVAPLQSTGPASSALPSARAAADAPDTTLLLKKIAKREKKIKGMTTEMETLRQSLESATQRVKHLELEQEQFFEDVQEMKTQFDKLAQHHQKIMWEYLPSHDADMAAIPLIAAQIPESPTGIGKYPLQDVLGYGQYATVYASSIPEEPDLAIKVIDKDKLIDLVALVRVNAEIASLRDTSLAHPGILAIKDVIHTRKYIYLVTERGGKDLFDHFGVRQDGLSEDVIRPLMLRVAQAVQVLHRHNYCHRDLKPENILYSPDGAPEHLVKLIDFGLCTKAVTAHDPMLHDFCGSPGFFAPEILLSECYDGMKADVWSLGCILLELVIGNTLFVSLWMAMYELDVLKDRQCFRAFVQQGLAQVREHCQSPKWVHSTKLRQLLFSMLCEKPQERYSIHQMLDHPWFHASPSSAAGPHHAPPLHDPPSAHPHSHADATNAAAAATAPLTQRSLAKVKSLSTSSVSSPGQRIGASAGGARPLSAESDSLAHSTNHHHHHQPQHIHHRPTAFHGSSGSPPGPLSVVAAALPLHAPSSLAGAPSLLSPRPRVPVVSVKVSLPSLSPEKPSGSRAPDKPFTKRSPPTGE